MRNLLFASALVALGLSVPAQARAQGMDGGNMGGGDEKKDDSGTPKADDGKKDDGSKPADPPKPTDPAKPAEPPKADPPKASKTLSLDAPTSWTEGKEGKGKGGGGKGGAAGGAVKGRYSVKAADGDSEGAHAELRALGRSGDYDKEVAFFIRPFETADGKKLEKSAVKSESFDTTGGVKVKTAEIAGTFAPGGGMKKKKDDAGGDAKKAPDKKPGYKSLTAFLDGPDGTWIARITGPEKTVEKARDDFMKWVKSAKVVEGAAAPPSSGGDKKDDKKDDD